MKRLINIFKKKGPTKGANMMDYALLVILFGVLSIVAVASMSSTIQRLYNDVTHTLSNTLSQDDK